MQEDRNHLGEGDLAKLLEEARQLSGPMVDTEQLHPHFVTCTDCRQKYEVLVAFDRQLRSSIHGQSTAQASDCPKQEVWREVAAGIAPADWTLVWVEHASRCNHCSPLLRGAVAELSSLHAKITDAERKQIAALDSANLQWQQRLGQRIAGTTEAAASRESRWWKQWFSAPRMAAVGISVAALVVAGSWFVAHRKQPAVADQLLARAYTEKRTLELRIAGASYAPLRVALGPAASFTSRPPALLKAEAMIAGQLASRPSDPAWLQAKAKADVLEGKYDAAVEALRRALELEPHSPALLTDLATAYFQRAQQEDRKEDFGAAYEYLSQALQAQPDDPVALFNRAIVAEHQFLYQQALEDWEHYLRVDPSSAWTEEARNRANAVKAKLKEHAEKSRPLLSPAELVTASTSGESEVDERIEEYLHEAVRSWVPQAFPEAKANADENARQALFFLAELTQRRHNDLWLTDLLRGSSTGNFSQAAAALAEAVTANDTARFDVALGKSELAVQLFRKSGNAAGALRAEFEYSFADQINRRSEDCRQRSIAAAGEATHYAYRWVQIQLELEQSVCSVLMGDLGTYKKVARRAQDQAQQAGYGSLYLRAVYFEADSELNAGDRPAVWKLAARGFERYWSGQFPAMRGYSFYTVAAQSAEAADWPYLQLANWREAEALIDSSEDILARADTHIRVAKAASQVQQRGLAEREHQVAARLYTQAPQTAARRSDRIEIEIRTAQFEVRQNAPDAALGRLSRVQDEVRQLSNNLLTQIFYSALGEAQLRRHHAAEAEHAFRPALRLAEQNLASLASGAEKGTWSADAAPVYLGFAEAELVQGREQQALDVFEWYMGATQRVATHGLSASSGSSADAHSFPDPTRLSARLPLLSGQTVLAYGALPDGLAIWVYDNRGVRAKWIPKSVEELQDRATGFYAICADPNSDLAAVRRESQELYSLLISPIEEWLDPKRTLVIEATGFLDRIPFEALIDNSGHYLIERAAIVHSQGLYAEARMRAEAEISRDLPALVVGSAASSPDAGLFAVPNVSAAADAVAGRFHAPRVLKGPEAMASAVTSSLPGAAVFHFAGHAITTPSHSGLMLIGPPVQPGDAKTAGPVLLDASAVRRLDLRNMRLAVLAACNSDAGDVGSRGFDSVAAAFQDSGVPHVVASRWAVDALESAVYMDSFYSSLLSGRPVSQAIRETSSKMLQNSQTAHPYHWAAFAAYGRP